MVLFCKTSGSIPGITYFRLTSRRHDAWLNALGRDPSIEHLSDTNRICSIHFLPHDFTQKGGKLVLKPGAIPTQNLGIQRNQTPLMSNEDIDSIFSEDSIMNEMSNSMNNYEDIEKQIIFEKMEIKLEENEEYQQCTHIKMSPTPSGSSQSKTTVDLVGDFLEFHGILYLIFILLGLYLYSSKKEESEAPTASEHIRNIKREPFTSSTTDTEGFRGPIKKAKN